MSDDRPDPADLAAHPATPNAAVSPQAAAKAAEHGFEPVADAGPFTDMIGPMFHKTLDDGSRQLALYAERRHLNSGGIVHGGLLMTLIDNTLGRHVYYQLPAGSALVTLSLNTDFVAAGREGDFIVGRARIVRMTRSVVFVEGTLSRDDTVLLNAQGIWKILRRPD
ncbi:hypothetical protein CCR85_04580 [Rhodothalassium salexigens]|uniref:PaaI family thioesterase n=1 Tax=Rhodothalassium salexigens TaxID=1086 RepID=UPI0019114CF3|nr:PaaI family thioesterase [Rhodothalassium salexigens]MBK5910768.1 hypothetical protein [Rhodothalassium salexigens]MBK5920514.1 hypothetical protein [Rhodothalassium salexigens]